MRTTFQLSLNQSTQVETFMKNALECAHRAHSAHFKSPQRIKNPYSDPNSNIRYFAYLISRPKIQNAYANYAHRRWRRRQKKCFYTHTQECVRVCVCTPHTVEKKEKKLQLNLTSRQHARNNNNNNTAIQLQLQAGPKQLQWEAKVFRLAKNTRVKPCGRRRTVGTHQKKSSYKLS